MELVLVCIGISVTLFSIVFLLSRWSNRKSLVPSWPVIGMTPSVFYNASRIHDFVTQILQQSNGTFVLKGPWLCGMDYIITSDPMNVHYTYSKNFSNYTKGPESHEMFESFLGDGVFNADSDSWRVQRSMVHSLLKDKRFELAVRTSLRRKISEGLFLVLDHACKIGNKVDLQDIFERFNFDNICLSVLGMDPNTLSIGSARVSFGKVFDDIGDVVLYRHIVPRFMWKLQRWLQIGEEKKMTKACQMFNNFLNKCIESKQEQLQINNDNSQFDVLTYFMQLENENRKEGKLSKKFLRDMAINLVFAGRDTTSAALSWTFWLIAKNPNVETNILKEMERHFGSEYDDKLRFFDFEKLKKLVYLHAVICEVLRLYPSVSFGHRVSLEADVLPSGHRIGKNTNIFYSFYSMGRMKEIWSEDCLEFKPERWISESGGIKHQPSYKFVAFNAGPRSCLGKDLSILQMKAIVCGILWNYCVELVKDQRIVPLSSPILHQKNGMKIRVYRRN